MADIRAFVTNLSHRRAVIATLFCAALLFLHDRAVTFCAAPCPAVNCQIWKKKSHGGSHGFRLEPTV